MLASLRVDPQNHSRGPLGQLKCAHVTACVAHDPPKLRRRSQGRVWKAAGSLLRPAKSP